MHTDMIEKVIARRLRTLADEPAEPPYDWADFKSRRQRAARTRSSGRNRLAAVAAAVVAVAVVAGIRTVRSTHEHTPTLAQVNATAHPKTPEPTDATLHANAPATASAGAYAAAPDAPAQARTRAIEGWLAGLPRDPVVVRVGTHVAVSSLQDQIAELDDLMSAERVAGAQPSRLEALERQRAQLVSSLAQLRYAEMLASATS